MVERGQHRHRARLGGDHVSHGEGRQRGRFFRTGGGREARHRLDHRAEARTITVRSVLAPARDAHHHEPRVLPGERLPAEAPLLERPRHVVLDEDIGVLHELFQEGLSRRRGQVQRDRALAPGVDLPPELAEGLGPGAERIARPGILHLDDVGPEIGQHGGEHAARDQPRAVDHPEIAERARRRAHDRVWLLRASSLKCRSSASIRRPSASFSVRPVTVTVG